MGLTQEQAGRASEQGVVVDMKDLTGLPQNVERVDIDILLTENPDTFNLMLLALRDMMQDDSPVGWFQVAGIHGRPSTLWDGNGKQVRETWDGVRKGFDPMRWGGYCAHGLLTFGPWHRPYLAMLEQSLYRRMRKISGLYTDPTVKSRYLAAAQKFRLPYFDYFRPRGPGFSVAELKGFTRQDDGTERLTSYAHDFRLPEIFNIKEVTVRLYPDNVPKSVDNPLYAYKFKEPEKSFTSHDLDALKKRSTSMTLRCARGPAADKHGADQLRYNLNQMVAGRITIMLNILTDPPYQNFKAVATDQLVEGDFTDGPSGSLEGSLHADYHNLIGGGGHMEDGGFAAFDPVFWFHHCNIDRYFALWQLANPEDPKHPERWFPKPMPAETVIPVPGGKAVPATYDGDKPLWPFYRERTSKGVGKYWTADLVRNTEALGYVYDDVARMKTMNPAPKSVGDYMRMRYNFATRTPDFSVLGDSTMRQLYDKVKDSPFFKPEKNLVAPPAAGKPPVVSHRMAAMAAPASELHFSSAPAPPMAPNPIDPIFDRDWYIDSKVKRMAANGTFTIYFFLSPHGALPDNEPYLYASSPYLVGQHHIFTASREGCENCAEAEEEGRLSVSTTVITSALLHYREEVEGNGVDSLRPEHITPFLVGHLRWRVVFQGFDRKDPRLPGLELEVGVSAKIYHDDGEPTYENYPDVFKAIIENAN